MDKIGECCEIFLFKRRFIIAFSLYTVGAGAEFVVELKIESVRNGRQQAAGVLPFQFV